MHFVPKTQVRPAAEHGVIHISDLSDDRETSREGGAQFTAQVGRDLVRQGKPGPEMLFRSVQYFSDQLLRQGTVETGREVLLLQLGGSPFTLGIVDATSGQIGRCVLPEVDELKSGANLIGQVVKSFVVNTGKVQHATPYRVGAVAAVIEKGIPIFPTFYFNVHTEGR